jgi:hypothetical protein
MQQFRQTSCDTPFQHSSTTRSFGSFLSQLQSLVPTLLTKDTSTGGETQCNGGSINENGGNNHLSSIINAINRPVIHETIQIETSFFVKWISIEPLPKNWTVFPQFVLTHFRSRTPRLGTPPMGKGISKGTGKNRSFAECRILTMSDNGTIG